MNQNRSQLFAQRLESVAAEYDASGQTWTLKAQKRSFKIAVVGGEVQFKLASGEGAVDGLVRESDGIVTFENMEAFSRVSVKQASGTITELRIWAY